MKMKPEDYNKLEISIIKALMDSGQNLRHMAKTRSEKRLRWDLTYINPDTNKLICGMYDYLNDNHIDTALKSIVKNLMHF